MIKKSDVDKEVTLIGEVRTIYKPYVRITEASFECPSCGTIHTIIQRSYYIKEPKRCACGRKGGFKIVSHKEAEGQEIVVLEKGTEFAYKIYIEKENLLRKLVKLNEESMVEVKGIVQIEYKKDVAVGDLVLIATKIEKIVHKK